MMIDYELLPAMGPGTTKKRGSLAELVHDIPYFITNGLIPPPIVLESVLREGVVDAGMSGGCRWQPFDMTAAQYEEIVRELERSGLVRAETPDWVATRSDWTAWMMEHRNSVPSAEHRRLTAIYE